MKLLIAWYEVRRVLQLVELSHSIWADRKFGETEEASWPGKFQSLRGDRDRRKEETKEDVQMWFYGIFCKLDAIHFLSEGILRSIRRIRKILRCVDYFGRFYTSVCCTFSLWKLTLNRKKKYICNYHVTVIAKFDMDDYSLSLPKTSPRPPTNLYKL